MRSLMLGGFDGFWLIFARGQGPGQKVVISELK